MMVLRIITAQIKTLMQCWSVPVSWKMKQRFHMAFKMGRIVCECWQCKWKGMNEDGVSMSCLEGLTKKLTLYNNVREKNLWNYGRRDCVCGCFACVFVVITWTICEWMVVVRLLLCDLRKWTICEWVVAVRLLLNH
jgi:hypothetical protein